MKEERKKIKVLTEQHRQDVERILGEGRDLERILDKHKLKGIGERGNEKEKAIFRRDLMNPKL